MLMRIGGVATDYGVRAIVVDAAALGFEVLVLKDAVRGVDAERRDAARGCGDMDGAGARSVDRVEVTGELRSRSERAAE